MAKPDKHDDKQTEEASNYEEWFLTQNPPTKPKPLPHRMRGIAARGNEGTLVYSPDIAVFVYTDNHGIIDLGPYITQVQIVRNVNNISTVLCNFDNKYRRYDRVIQRMNRIVVFLKRIEWLQVFSGYVTNAPWETVVPGDAQLMAECTLKRIVHQYWDQSTREAALLFPFFNVDGNWKFEDGGAATSMFKLLTMIGKWPKDQIMIQRIPEEWLTNAAKLLKNIEAEQYDPLGTEYGLVVTALKNLLDYRGLNPNAPVGGTTNTETGSETAIPQQSSLEPTGTNAASETAVRNNFEPGNLPGEAIKAITEIRTTNGRATTLRIDAAEALQALLDNQFANNQERNTAIDLVTIDYNSYDRYTNSQPMGIRLSDIGYGIVFAVKPPSQDKSDNITYKYIENNCTTFGFSKGALVNGAQSFIFIGNDSYQIVKYAPGGPGSGFWQTSTPSTPPTDAGQLTDPTEPGPAMDNVVSNAFLYYPGIDPNSYALTGSKAWINDVPLIQSVALLAQASMRDFQSAPNGAFVAFYPDRLGILQQPALVVHDIEVTDFKLAISDSQLVTHFVSVGNYIAPADPSVGGLDMAALISAGMITVEMDQLMTVLLGIDTSDWKPTETSAIGKWMLNRFGLRPMRQDNFQVRNRGWNFTIALHRFQELWAQQWQTYVQFTFLPELYPGMRIELADHGLSVYVEQVSHSISRSAGFMTQAVVSSPMKKVNGKWQIIRAEFPAGPIDPEDFIGSDKRDYLESQGGLPHRDWERHTPGLDEGWVEPGQCQPPQGVTEYTGSGGIIWRWDPSICEYVRVY